MERDSLPNHSEHNALPLSSQRVLLTFCIFYFSKKQNEQKLDLDKDIFITHELK